MANPPEPPVAVQRRVVKRVCSLPPRVQRRLFGAPPTLDGQTLASDIHALIKLGEAAGSKSILNGMGPLEARVANRIGAEVVGYHPPIPMARVEALTVPGGAGPIPCRLYEPGRLPAGEAPPLLVYYHGGGWVIGDLDTHDGVCRFLAERAGVLVLSVDYRLAPEHPFPAPVEDAWSAYRWALENAATLGADPARVAVGGDSAGGNMSAGVSLLARGAGVPVPAMQLLIYPVTDTSDDTVSRGLFAEGFMLTRSDMDIFEGWYLPAGTDTSDPRISVLRAPDLSGLPLTYLTTAGFDPLRDEGEAFGARLREAGVRVAHRRHPGLVHSFANLTAVSRSSRAAMSEAAGALRMGLASAVSGA